MHLKVETKLFPAESAHLSIDTTPGCMTHIKVQPIGISLCYLSKDYPYSADGLSSRLASALGSGKAVVDLNAL